MRLTKAVTRIFYIPDDPDNGSVTVKYLKHNEIQAITGEIETVSFNPVNRDGVRTEFNPWEKLRAFAHASITGWNNMYDEIGRPLDFSPTNLDKAAEFEVTVDKKLFGFYVWIDRCRNELAKDVEKEAAAAKGNLKTSESGSQ